MRIFVGTVVCALSTLAAASSPAEIVPTPDPGSDCVAAKIYAGRTSRNLKYDKLYCSVNKDRTAFDLCVRNSAENRTIAFFTDRCNAPAEGAYLSFNGKTHTVHRQPGHRHPEVDYAGIWSGAGVTVRIVPVRRIKRDEDDRVIYSVDVIIQSGGRSATIPARYDNRL